MTKKTVRDIDLTGNTVLVRVDYNVPIDDGKVGDTLRIRSSFDTINYLLGQNCKLVLISHLGRPDGKPEPKYSLEPVAAAAAKLLQHPIKFIPATVGTVVETAVAAMQPKDIILLENLRFHPQEESNDEAFAQQLAALADVYVDDAFAAIHRAHASTVGVTKHLPSVAGLLVEREVDTITAALNSPRPPLVAIIGGAKVSDKIEVLTHLVSKVDVLIIGGAMANTFLAAEGYEVGQSKYEADQIDTAQHIRAEAESSGVQLILPTDAVVTTAIKAGAKGQTVDLADVGPDDIIADIGPATIQTASASLRLAGTVLWNGPMGITEIPAFAGGSIKLARLIADSAANSLIGGGDTAAFIDAAGLHDQFGFVSTGGGASLELMAGKKLPGVEALLDK
jgi:phosphoglycerate kinase